jgi:hypothetical protein
MLLLEEEEILISLRSTEEEKNDKKKKKNCFDLCIDRADNYNIYEPLFWCIWRFGGEPYLCILNKSARKVQSASS